MWSYDFVSTRTHDGRALKLLTVLDEYTRRCLTIRVGRRTRSDDVLEVLADLFARHGPPEHLRSDNGPEFTAKLVRRWLARLRVQTLYIAPGSPWENGYNESFNGQAEERVLERRDLLHTARGRRTRRAVAAGVQYRSTPQRLRRSTPRSGSIETITLVPQNASAPGTANGFRSNIASGTAGGGTSPAVRYVVETIDPGEEWSLTELAKSVGRAKSTVHEHVQQAIEAGWLGNKEWKEGFPSRLVRKDDLPDANLSGLPSVDQLRRKMNGEQASI